MEYQIILNYETENEEIVDTANSYEEGLYLLQKYQIAFNSSNFILKEVFIRSRYMSKQKTDYKVRVKFKENEKIRTTTP